MANVGNSAVTNADRPVSGFKGKTSVNGPGQNAVVRISA